MALTDSFVRDTADCVLTVFCWSRQRQHLTTRALPARGVLVTNSSHRGLEPRSKVEAFPFETWWSTLFGHCARKTATTPDIYIADPGQGGEPCQCWLC